MNKCIYINYQKTFINIKYTHKKVTKLLGNYLKNMENLKFI